MVARAAHDVAERVAEALLALAIVVGSAFLWIGLPLGGFWLAGEFTTTAEGSFAVLGGIPLAMVAFGWLLYRVNDLYVSVRDVDQPVASSRSAWLVASTEERNKLRRARAPRTLIDAAMTASATVALLLLAVWFFFLAGSPMAFMDLIMGWLAVPRDWVSSFGDIADFVRGWLVRFGRCG